MLSSADDYLLHQTHEPIRYAGTSDRRFYDRYFFTGHACSDQLFFMVGLGCYPNLGVIDAFASISYENKQLTVRGSRELGADRTNTNDVGPISVVVREGLKRLVVRCEHGSHPVEFELEWTAAIEAIEEPPIFNRTLGRVIEQGTRLIQTGYWTGFIQVSGRRFELSPAASWGARDRSWGVRSMGLEREPRGLQQARGAAFNRPPLWIWSPMQFPSGTIHFNISEHASGLRDAETVLSVPSLNREASLEVLGWPDHNLRLDPRTRELLDGSVVSFRNSRGDTHTVTLTPLRRSYLRAGTGYGGPDKWRHGMYMGERWADWVEYDLNDSATTAVIGPAHVLCRMQKSDGEVGYGTFETQVFGAYPKYGFAS